MKRAIDFTKSFAALSVCCALATGPAYADRRDDLSDILYQSTDWGAGELRSRGYVLVHSDQHDRKTWQYWWRDHSNTCVKARAVAGKYDELTTTASTDCGQYHEAATKGSAAAGIAIGAAALLGVAALAHQSHERDEKHGNDSRSVAEFDRGYRDGKHHERYHNYNKTEAYSDGYNAGQRERDEETHYRPRDGYHSAYHPYVSVDDLVGAKASSADSELRARGFRDMGGYKQDGKSHVTWYNARSRQCVDVVTKEGRIHRIGAIDEGNCT
jgi:hypothetical protein